MADFVIVIVVAVVIAAASWYIRKEKKKGAKCIGCPTAGVCSMHRGTGECNCSKQ